MLLDSDKKSWLKQKNSNENNPILKSFSYLFVFKNRIITYIYWFIDWIIKRNKKMDQLQHCTKCLKVPEDILMLTCGHDLCLTCSAERLAV